MNRSVMLSLLLVALWGAACSRAITTTKTNPPPASPNSTPDAFAASRTLYVKNCKECHGEKGDGGPVKLADGTKLKVPSLREGHALRHSDAEFVKQITKGGDGMPAFQDKLKPAEISDLINLIRSEFQGSAPAPAQSAAPAKGAK